MINQELPDPVYMGVSFVEVLLICIIMNPSQSMVKNEVKLWFDWISRIAIFLAGEVASGNPVVKCGLIVFSSRFVYGGKPTHHIRHS